MILSVPVAQFNAIVLRYGVLVARIDRLDRHFVESLEQVAHDSRRFTEVSIGDDSPRLLTLAFFLVVVSYQYLIRLNKSLKKVDKARKSLCSIFVLQVWNHRVVFLSHVPLDDRLNVHDYVPVLLAVPSKARQIDKFS